jgi:hypothetical protein
MAGCTEARVKVFVFALLTAFLQYICVSLIKFTDFKSNSTLLVFWCMQFVFEFIYIIVLCSVSDELNSNELSGHACSIPFCILFYIAQSAYLFIDISPGTGITFAWWFYSVTLGIVLVLGLVAICVVVYIRCKQAIIDYFRGRKQWAGERQAIQSSLEDTESESSSDDETV